MIAVVYAVPGREDITRATLEHLSKQGPGFLVWHSDGLVPAPFKVKGWPVIRSGPVRGGDLDYWDVLRFCSEVAPGEPALIMEDDILPCRNFLPYVKEWAGLYREFATSFYNFRSQPPGILYDIPFTGWWGNQAMWYPPRILEMLLAVDPISLRRYPEKPRSQDFSVGDVLKRNWQKVYVHRSLVQHVGYQSTIGPGRLVGNRKPATDYVGEDFDALTLLDR